VIGEDGSFLLGPLKLARGVFVSGTGEYSIEFEEGYRKLDKALVTELARNPDVLTHRLPPRQPWSEGLAAQLDDKAGKWGFVDPARNFVIAPQFDAVSSFKNGVAWAAFPDRREWCQIDKMGNIKPGTRCQCGQPLVIVEHYSRPSDIACYDDGIRIVRGSPVIRGNAVIR
jgi:WG containing repeat